MKDTLLSLAFDFGTKSIGVAIGQRITNSAYPLVAIKAKNGNPDWILIKKYLLDKWRPDEIIVGLPLNMDGTKQPFTTLVYEFSNKIHNFFKIPVILHDERLSTVEAKEKLFNNGGFRKFCKGKIDSISAMIILESYFRKK